MKNKIKILFLSIFMLFAFGNYLISQLNCDPDNSMFVPITINGCPYEVLLCFNCPPTGDYSSVRVQGWGKTAPCNQTLTDNEVYSLIWDIVMEPEFLRTLIHDCLNQIPPCELIFENYYLEKFEWICWEKWNHGGRVFFIPCENAPYCKTIYEICYDSMLDKYITTLNYGPQTFGDPDEDCPSFIVAPDPPFNQHSSCFQFETSCTP
jgi:hypothetical protein